MAEKCTDGCKCSKEKEIDEMHQNVKKILLLINGNGQIGLCGKVQVLWVGFTVISATLASMIIKELWACL